MWGRFEHSLDEKGRLIIPQLFRNKLGEEFVLIAGAGSHIRVYPMPIWQAIEEQLASESFIDELDTDLIYLQRMFGNCDFVNLDQQNRVSLPRHLRDWAELKEGNSAIILGSGTRLEIWNPTKWNEYTKEFKEGTAAAASKSHRLARLESNASRLVAGAQNGNGTSSDGTAGLPKPE